MFDGYQPSTMARHSVLASSGLMHPDSLLNASDEVFTVLK